MSNEFYEKIKHTAKNSLVEVVLNTKMYVTQIKNYFILQKEATDSGIVLQNVKGYFKGCAEDLILIIFGGCSTNARQVELHIPLPAIKDYKVKSD
ncbi:MAG: hypothetical protein QW063_01330 [Candidatus Nanoarchaeia archaeon]